MFCLLLLFVISTILNILDQFSSKVENARKLYAFTHKKDASFVFMLSLLLICILYSYIKHFPALNCVVFNERNDYCLSSSPTTPTATQLAIKYQVSLSLSLSVSLCLSLSHTHTHTHTHTRTHTHTYMH